MDDYVAYEKAVHGSFLVAAYRRPDFRVDVTLDGGTVKAGDTVKGAVAGQVPVRCGDAGAPGDVDVDPHAEQLGAAGRARRAARRRPLGVRRLDVERSPTTSRGREPRSEDARAAGELALDLPTKLDAGVPYVYTLEADVEDVSRQHIANRASVTVHPAPWYVGVRRPELLPRSEDRPEDRADRDLAGRPDRGRRADRGQADADPVEQRAPRRRQRLLHLGDRAEAGARRLVDGDHARDKPVPLNAPLPSGGYFELEATAREASGRFAVTRTSFYVLGAGYTAWERYDHNRIDLVADKPRYKPGDTARIMIQSPWEQATALVTTEREGIRSHRQFALTSTQQSVSIPVTEDGHSRRLRLGAADQGAQRGVPAEPPTEAPKGGPYAIEDPSDPGKPAFRLGYVELAGRGCVQAADGRGGGEPRRSTGRRTTRRSGSRSRITRDGPRRARSRSGRSTTACCR